MMVSVAIGLIVALGAVSLIVAIDRSNSETIQSTRLTQELRALATIIAEDVKRSRGISDPIGMVGRGATACSTTAATPLQPCYPITPTAGSASCMSYGYSGPALSGNTYTSGVLANSYIYNYRYISLSNGNLILTQMTFDPTAVAEKTALPTTAQVTAACPIAAALTHTTLSTTTLSSREVSITGLTFSFVNAGEIDLSITGKLLAGDSYSNTISRTFTQPIFIRSSAL